MSNSDRGSSRYDFRAVEQRQWKRSFFLFVVLVVFYFFALGLVTAALLFPFGLFLYGASPHLFTDTTLLEIVGGLFVVSFLVAWFHLYDARATGAKFILQRLDAEPPDPDDRYHQQFAHLVEEIRLACGLPQVRAYVIPSAAINSMALIEADGTPAVIGTEGLLAQCTREEQQAVVSHELAHILRGDTSYLTLVCSLANFFERLQAALEPDTDDAQAGRRQGGAALAYLAVTFSSVVMHLLSTLISRQRELLADAAAVELCRNPLALAQAIYKAQTNFAFVGDFSLTYSPIFIVDPESNQSSGWWANLFSTHPPLYQRLKLLAGMANTTPEAIVADVWSGQKQRDTARGTVAAFAAPADAPPPVPEEVNQVWSIRDQHGQWQGPYSMEALLALPFFTPLIALRNLPEHTEAPAREFTAVRQALGSIGGTLDAAHENKCPRCHQPLVADDYEGVQALRCKFCGGTLLAIPAVERILTRREISFSPALVEQAQAFQRQHLLNPLTAGTKNLQSAPALCPHCGAKMMTLPYSYEYFVLVDKCLICDHIWFDANELEILQILVEQSERENH